MGWLALISGLIKIASAIASYMADKQLIEAGEAKQLAKDLKGTNERIQRAIAARRAVKHDDPDELRNDPNRRK